MENNEKSTKILIVDDEPDVEVLMKQRFRRQIRESKFELFFAHNGLEALDQLSKDLEIRLVISDINMPEMDGLTLLRNINEKFPAVIPIIVSAYGDMNNIRAAMNLGAFDFVTKPINFDDLNVTIDKTLTHIQNLLDAQKTRSRLDGILHELNVASEIQQSILPRNFISDTNIEMFAKMAAAKEIGGDFYDFFWLDDAKSKLAIVIADVSGKGVPAALFMTVSRTLIRAHAYNHLGSPGGCLTKVNSALQKDNTNVMFVTTFYGILDVNTGVLTYTNAGHNPSHIIRKGGQVETMKNIHGMALAVIEDLVYKEDQITLNIGDTLFLYTDGVTEAENPSGALLGDEKLIASLDQYRNLAPSELINTIRSDIITYANGWPQSDDITMLAIRYLAGKQTQ
ncbi:SpoIIE family protein phosphatase [Candidatus Berkiella aquae]|nr:SpoIIE family protein phosphatase [Candidatus Berkiella aquae]MCS5712001.1 SpoIIE family protein phosphatase [Candidatus Berkiella aquae]